MKSITEKNDQLDEGDPTLVICQDPDQAWGEGDYMDQLITDQDWDQTWSEGNNMDQLIQPIHMHHLVHSVKLLKITVYCALRAKCVTLPASKGWYEVVYYKLCMSGVADSSIFWLQDDKHTINQSLHKWNYTILCNDSLQIIWNTIDDILHNPDQSLDFSFNLKEDDTHIELLPNEEALLCILQSTTAFIERRHPIHWWNCVLQNLRNLQLNSVPLLSCALSNGDMNHSLHTLQLSSFHWVTLDALSQGLSLFFGS